MVHQWTEAQWLIYLTLNVTIAGCYFAYPYKLEVVIRRGRNEANYQRNLRLCQIFVWLCGFHHLVMVPLMFASSPIQFYLLAMVDLSVMCASLAAVIFTKTD